MLLALRARCCGLQVPNNEAVLYFSLNPKPRCIQHLKRRVLPRILAFPVYSVWQAMFGSVTKLNLCNLNQQNTHFSNECFNSILGVFYMFRTSGVHHQEDYLYMQFFMLCFSMHLYKQSSRWKDSVLYGMFSCI